MAEFDKIILNGTTYTIPEGGGGSVTVDDAITSGSTNPVENNAIYNAVNITDKAIYTYEPVNGEALLGSSSRFYIGKTARFIFYNWVYPKAYTYIKLSHSGQYIWYKITDWNDWENNPPVMQYATSSFTESSFTFGNLTPNKSFTVTNNSTYDLWGNIILYTTYNEVASGVDPGTVLDYTDYWLCPGVIQFEKDTTYSGTVKETAASIKDILPVPIYKADDSGYLFTETDGNLRVKRAYFNPLTGKIYNYSNDYQNVLKIDTVDFSYSTNDGLKFVKSQYSPSSSPALEVTDVDEWQQSEISTNIYFNYYPMIIFRLSGNGNASISLSDGNNRNLSINISRNNSYLRVDLNFNHGDVSSNKNLTYYTGLDEITVPFEVLGLSSEELTGPITVQNQWIEPGFVESFSVYQSSQKVSFDIWQQKTDYLLGQQEIKEEVTSRALNYINDKIEALKRTVHDLESSVSAINERTQNVITTTEGQSFGEAVVNAGGFTGLDATDSATALAELGYQPQE